MNSGRRSLVHSVLLLAAPLAARADGPGTAGAAFLKIGAGARPAAMGEAFAGLADDVHAVYWNPGGLSALPGTELAFMHDAWLEGVSLEHLAAARRLGDSSVLGLSVTTAGSGDIPKVDRTGASRGRFDARDWAAGVSLGWSADERLRLGATLKGVRLRIADHEAEAAAGDVGAVAELGPGWQAGLAVQNLGGKLKFRVEEDPLPLVVRGGLSFRAGAWTGAFDLVKWRDRGVHAHAGLERRWRLTRKTSGALRAGYRTDAIDDLGAVSGLTGGLGLRSGHLELDYAWTPYAGFGLAHRIGLTLKWPGLDPTEARDESLARAERKARARAQARAERDRLRRTELQRRVESIQREEGAKRAFDAVKWRQVPPSVQASPEDLRRRRAARLYEQAERLLRERKYSEAIRAIEELLRLDPNDARARDLLSTY